MMDLINKMNNLSHAISDVLTKKRLKKLVKTILVKPVTKAMEKQEMPFDEEDFKEEVYEFIDKFSPETLNALLMMLLMKNANDPRTVDTWMRFLNSDDIQSSIEKFVSSIENNAEDIGKIVKKICMVSLKIMDELTNDDESEDSDEESDVPMDKDSLLLIMKIMGTAPVASKGDDADDEKEDSDEEGNKSPSEKVEPQISPETPAEEAQGADCVEETESTPPTEHIEETSIETEQAPTVTAETASTKSIPNQNTLKKARQKPNMRAVPKEKNCT